MEAKRILKDIDVQFLSLVTAGANGKSIIYKSANQDTPNFTKEIKIIKTDDEKHLVYATVYEPDTVDSQGDTANASEIEKACHKFSENLRLLKVDTQHDFDPNGSIVVENNILRAADPMFPTTKTGSWVTVIKVAAEDIWAQIKNGTIGGLSLAGLSHVEEVKKGIVEVQKPAGGWTSPDAGDAPESVKKILAAAYGSCRDTWAAAHPDDIENATNKTSCAKQAWGAVENAGWKKDSEGKWNHVKKSDNREDLNKGVGTVKEIIAKAKAFLASIKKDYNAELQEDDLQQKTWALMDAFYAIFDDAAITDKKTAIMASVDQFKTDVGTSAVTKAGKKISQANLDKIEAAHKQLSELIASVTAETTNDEEDTMKAEEVQKIVADTLKTALKPITDQITKIAGDVTTATARIEEVAKASPGSKQIEDDPTKVKKSAKTNWLG
jgi:hypothetical protein